ncbi:MAG: type II toxin-antitoxin system VapC family toxin [Spirochaetales bacterium]|nr:type II toxin-antitoxin system VapC family toxin [Spirochaetales bacterium]
MKIYLDTSALIKLYIFENGSKVINQITAQNAAPLPVWDLHLVEFHNAIKLMVFREEITGEEAGHLCSLFKERKKAGIYYSPELDREDHTELCLEYTNFSPKFGCRSLDIMHVAAAALFKVDQFITFDSRQADLAREIGMNTYFPEQDLGK